MSSISAAALLQLRSRSEVARSSVFRKRAAAGTNQAGDTRAGQLEVSVLGPLRILRNGRAVELGPGRRRILAAALVADAGLWGSRVCPERKEGPM